jgi:hypothetical protein
MTFLTVSQFISILARIRLAHKHGKGKCFVLECVSVGKEKKSFIAFTLGVAPSTSTSGLNLKTPFLFVNDGKAK